MKNADINYYVLNSKYAYLLLILKGNLMLCVKPTFYILDYYFNDRLFYKFGALYELLALSI